MKTFKYKWKMHDNEIIGSRDCDDEASLRRHVEANGGQLIEILEVQEKAAPKYTMLKKCPYCAEEIQPEAIKCRHCGSDLLKRSEPTYISNVRSNPSHADSYRPPQGGNNGLAITSFVLGILAVITSALGIGFLLAIIAVSLGPGGRDSKYSALAGWGMLLGWFVIIGSILVAILWGSIWAALIFSSFRR